MRVYVLYMIIVLWRCGETMPAENSLLFSCWCGSHMHAKEMKGYVSCSQGSWRNNTKERSSKRSESLGHSLLAAFPASSASPGPQRGTLGMSKAERPAPWLHASWPSARLPSARGTWRGHPWHFLPLDTRPRRMVPGGGSQGNLGVRREPSCHLICPLENREKGGVFGALKHKHK